MFSIPVENRHYKYGLVYFSQKNLVKKGELTGTNVPGKKNMPSRAIVFIAELSLLVSMESVA